MYAFVKETDKAVPFYQEAFGATVHYNHYGDEDLLPDGTYMHVELKFDSCMLGLSEQSENNPDSIAGEQNSGNIMQFILMFEANEEDKLRKAYEVLSEGAKIYTPLQEYPYAYLICDLTDKFGIRWCMGIAKK